MHDGSSPRDNTTPDRGTLSAGTFVDVTVLFLEDDAVQFLALRSDGACADEIITTNIPTGVPLPPSLAIQRPDAGRSINCDVRRFFVHEEV
jgi:predicted amidohydrolase